MYPSLFPVSPQQADWWDQGFSRRKPIYVDTFSLDTLTDYQVLVNVTYDDDMQTDFDDLLFAFYNETDGVTTELSYWVEKQVDSAYALVWIKIPQIPASSSVTVHMYYGNSGVSSASDGFEVFEPLGFDDFERLNTGSFAGQAVANDPWSKSADNPLLSLGQTWASVLHNGTMYLMYYSRGVADYVGLRTSNDGLSWVDQGSVLMRNATTRWNEDKIWCPMVWLEDGTYHMIMTGRNATAWCWVGYANSTNGLSWIEDPNNPVFDATWTTTCTENWGVMKDGSTYYMYFNRLGYDPRVIGVATAPNPWGPWTEVSDSPTFGYHTFCAFPFKYNGEYYLLSPKYSVGGDYSVIELWKSGDPTFPVDNREFVRYAGIFGDSGLWDGQDVDTPAVLTDDVGRDTFGITGGQIWTYYAGQSSSGWNEGLMQTTDIASALTPRTEKPIWYYLNGMLAEIQSATTFTGNRAMKTNAYNYFFFEGYGKLSFGLWTRISQSIDQGRLEYYFYGDANTDSNHWMGAVGFNYDGRFVYTNNLGTFYTAETWRNNEWYYLEYRFNDIDKTFDIEIYDDNMISLLEVVDNPYANSAEISSGTDCIRWYKIGGWNGEIYNDNVRLRKWNDPEPTMSFGLEETGEGGNPSSSEILLPSNSTVIDVKVRKYDTQLSLESDKTTVIPNEPVTFISNLTVSGSQTPLAGATVSFYVNGTLSASGTTDANGLWTYQTSFDAAAVYETQSQFEKWERYTASESNLVLITVNPPTYSTSLSLVADQTLIYEGESVSFTSTLLYGNGTKTGQAVGAGKPVSLYVNTARMADGTTDTNGEWQYSYTFTQQGNYTVQSSFAGGSFSPHHSISSSSQVQISVVTRSIDKIDQSIPLGATAFLFLFALAVAICLPVLHRKRS